MRARLTVLTLILALVPIAVATAGTAGGSSGHGLAPYRPPTFHCKTVHRYGNGVAPPLTLKGDPLCVVYNKRDITVDNGGAIRFLLAEPARFAVAGKCQYWQRDHGKVRIDRGFEAVVEWDGSYWWDLKKGDGAAILRNFRIAGQPAGAAQVAKLVATVSPSMAKQIRRYGEGSNGGGGASMSFPPPPNC